LQKHSIEFMPNIMSN
ncbi:araC-type transcriptional regulator family protein, partial [Vibrio parahaemolyticus EKP-028]